MANQFPKELYINEYNSHDEDESVEDVLEGGYDSGTKFGKYVLQEVFELKESLVPVKTRKKS